MTTSTPHTNLPAHVSPGLSRRGGLVARAPRVRQDGHLASKFKPGTNKGGLATPKLAPRASEGGFTLVEVLIAASLSAFVLAGVLSAFVFMGRTGFRSSGYSEIEAEVRRGLETFAQDTRNATDVHWNNAQSITLIVNGSPVTYAYDAIPSSPTYRSFYRLPGAAGSGAPRTVLVRQVTDDFAFKRYKLAQPGVPDNTAQNDRETKLLQLTLRATRTSVAATGASQSALSARYLLRNKRVAN